MDPHARRVTEPLREAISAYESGLCTVTDLSRLAETAADALDNAHQSLRERLTSAARDLEYVAAAIEAVQQPIEVRRILGPVRAALGWRSGHPPGHGSRRPSEV